VTSRRVRRSTQKEVNGVSNKWVSKWGIYYSAKVSEENQGVDSDCSWDGWTYVSKNNREIRSGQIFVTLYTSRRHRHHAVLGASLCHQLQQPGFLPTSGETFSTMKRGDWAIYPRPATRTKRFTSSVQHFLLAVWRPLLPYGYSSYKASCPRPG